MSRPLRYIRSCRGAIWLAASYLCFSGCSGPTPSSRPGGESPESTVQDVSSCTGEPGHSIDSWLSSSPPEEARIYFDGSQSMRAFAGQGGGFRSMLEGLRSALLDQDISRSSVFKIGAGLESVAHSGGFESFDQPGFYTLGETNLAAALDAEIENPAPLTIVVTDGVMSLRQDLGQDIGIGDCGRGSDVQCLSLKVKRLVESGRGFWILGVRSRYRGILFSEQAGIGGTSLGTVDVPDRPLYVWVISPHVPTGRALARKILNRVGALPGSPGAIALEIAPGGLTLRLLDSDQIPISDTHLIPGNVRSGAVRGRFSPASAGQAPTQAVKNQGLDGAAFGLKVSLGGDALGEIPQGVTPLWPYDSSYCFRWEEPAGGAMLRIRVEEGSEALHMALLSSSFRGLAHRHGVLMRVFKGQRTTSESLYILDSWSTRDDRSVEMASRTLYFSDFIDALHDRIALPERYEQPVLRFAFE